jgi:hypothetical protein
MFSQWSSWLSRSPRVRRIVIKSWRVYLRVQRATLGRAVLVVRSHNGHVLAFATNSGELRLPSKELDGWRAVTTQVEEWISQLNPKMSRPRLLTIEGMPSGPGVTFVYSAEAASVSSQRDAVWLDPKDELSVLSIGDQRLLVLSKH